MKSIVKMNNIFLYTLMVNFICIWCKVFFFALFFLKDLFCWLLSCYRQMTFIISPIKCEMVLYYWSWINLEWKLEIFWLSQLWGSKELSSRTGEYKKLCWILKWTFINAVKRLDNTFGCDNIETGFADSEGFF